MSLKISLHSFATSSKATKKEFLLGLRNAFEENSKEVEGVVLDFIQNYHDKSEDPSNVELEALLLVATCILLYAKDELFLKVLTQTWLELRCRALRQLSEASDLDLRQTSGSYVGALCKRCGVQMYEEVREEVTSHINLLLKKCESAKEAIRENKAFKLPLGRSSSSTQENTPSHCTIDPDDIFSAWKLLDTWLYTLTKVAQCCGKQFCLSIDAPLVHCLQESVGNHERFVRESCCALIACLVADCALYHSFRGGASTCEQSSLFNAIVKVVCTGMCDAWPDVRLRACMAAKALLLSSRVKDGRIDQELLMQFLPYLCFNRYSKAEGLQKFSQASWVDLTKGRGQGLIESNFTAVINLYTHLLSQSDSSEVREVACRCISECIEKLDKTLVAARVVEVCKALGLMVGGGGTDGVENGEEHDSCSKEMVAVEGGVVESGSTEKGETVMAVFFPASDSLREAVCFLLHKLLCTFPSQSLPYVLAIFRTMLLFLDDSSSETVNSAAKVLAKTYEITGWSVFLQEMFKKIRRELCSVRERYGKEESGNGVGEEDGSGKDGEVERMEICESRLNAFKIDSVDSRLVLSTVSHQVEAWQRAEGCVSLMRHLCDLKKPEIDEKILEVLLLFSESLNVRDYEGRRFYVESVLCQLPDILRTVHWTVYHENLKLFLGVVIEFYSVSLDGSSARHSYIGNTAQKCLHELSLIKGDQAFSSLLKHFDPAFFRKVESLFRSG